MGDGRSSGARRRTRVADGAVIEGELGALRPGGVAGIAMASLLIEAATPMLSQMLPFTAQISLDWRVLSFTSAIALGSLVLFRHCRSPTAI